jgi:hypothetical protein
MTSLAERQAAVVAALVSGAPAPPGFDQQRVRAAADALLRKRAGEVAKVWPRLAASLGPAWTPTFAAWAATRPSAGAVRDGRDFAKSLPVLSRSAAAELAARDPSPLHRSWSRVRALITHPRRR